MLTDKSPKGKGGWEKENETRANECELTNASLDDGEQAKEGDYITCHMFIVSKKLPLTLLRFSDVSILSLCSLHVESI